MAPTTPTRFISLSHVRKYQQKERDVRKHVTQTSDTNLLDDARLSSELNIGLSDTTDF